MFQDSISAHCTLGCSRSIYPFPSHLWPTNLLPFPSRPLCFCVTLVPLSSLCPLSFVQISVRPMIPSQFILWALFLCSWCLWFLQSLIPLLHRTPCALCLMFVGFCSDRLLDELSLVTWMSILLGSHARTLCRQDKLGFGVVWCPNPSTWGLRMFNSASEFPITKNRC